MAGEVSILFFYLLYVTRVRSIEVDTSLGSIETVTLFGSNAGSGEIFRKVHIPSTALPNGENIVTLVVSNLPSSLDERSFRLECEDSMLVIGSHFATVTIGRESMEGYKAALNQLERELEENKSKESSLRLASTRLSSKLASIDVFLKASLSTGSAGSTGTMLPSLENAQKLIDYQAKEMERVHNELIQVEASLVTAAAAVAAAERRLADLRDSGRIWRPETVSPGDDQEPERGNTKYWPVERTTKTLYLRALLKSADEKLPASQLAIRYFAAPTAWAAEYDIRVDASSSDMNGKFLLTVHCYAKIWQATGEPWQESHLSLHTRTPGFSLAPEPRPRAVYYQELHRMQHARQKMARAGHPRAMNMMAVADIEEAESIDGVGGSGGGSEVRTPCVFVFVCSAALWFLRAPCPTIQIDPSHQPPY